METLHLMFKFIMLCIFNFYFLPPSIAQEIIEIHNGGFEDNIPFSFDIENGINSWVDCGLFQFYGESPPDIHNINSPLFGVTQLPQEGNHYLGMVTRSNDSFESISQKLPFSLVKDEKYYFSFFATSSRTLESADRITKNNVKFDNPVKIQVYLASKNCREHQLIYDQMIQTKDFWEQMDVYFTPDDQYNHIIFKAYYPDDIIFPTNGNVLIDQISNIVNVKNTDRSIDTSDQKASWMYAETIDFITHNNLSSIANSQSTLLNEYLFLEDLPKRVIKMGTYATITTLTEDELYSIQNASTFMEDSREILDLIHEVLNVQENIHQHAPSTIANYIEQVNGNNSFYEASKKWPLEFIDLNYEMMYLEIFGGKE